MKDVLHQHGLRPAEKVLAGKAELPVRLSGAEGSPPRDSWAAGLERGKQLGEGGRAAQEADARGNAIDILNNRSHCSETILLGTCKS